MKVKVGQLKAHLSKYLKSVQETGEPIEVCVREKGVAYLAPLPGRESAGSPVDKQLEARLNSAGLRVTQWGTSTDFQPIPAQAGDGKTLPNTIVALREERDW
jgi:prevent-host-death family protein